jgi:multidrug efflux pump subunit AcrB
VVEVFNGTLIAGDAIDIRIDRTRAAIEGVTPEEIRSALESQVGGVTSSAIQQGEKIIPIRVWASGDVRERVSSLTALTIRAQSGAVMPLSRVAEISIAVGQPQIVREDLRDMIAVTARLEGRDLGSAITEIRSALRSVALPPGVTISFGGLYQEQQKSFADLAIVLAAAALLVAALLLYLYENIAIVVAIMTVAGMSALAVFLGLWITGVELNISALMGMTMIIGIVTEIAIFFFAEIDSSRLASPEQLIAAGAARLRPILMTTLIGGCSWCSRSSWARLPASSSRR